MKKMLILIGTVLYCPFLLAQNLARISVSKSHVGHNIHMFAQTQKAAFNPFDKNHLHPKV
jgi:hypothetical protein